MEDGARTPPGWREELDSYGRPYYVHEISGEALWNRPTELKMESGESVLIRNEDDRRKFFVNIYREVCGEADVERFKRTAARPVPRPSVLYKEAKKASVEPQGYGQFIQQWLQEYVAKHAELADGFTIEIYGDVSQDVIETINRLGIPLKHFKTTRVGYVREKNFQEN